MKPCKFTFDETPVFDGYSHDSQWNGFDNVAVTQPQLEKIVAYFIGTRDYNTADDLMTIDRMGNGLISLGWGYCTRIVVDDDAEQSR